MISLKSLVYSIIFLILISFVPQAFAQNIAIGEPAKQTIEISINKQGDVHVIHQVEKTSTMKSVMIVHGTFSDLKVVDSEGNEAQHALVSGVNNSITIFPTNEDVTIEYDLEDVLQKNGEIWSWDFVYIANPIFIFPEEVDLVFANERPVKLDDLRGMRCHGCQVLIEYVLEEPVQKKVIKWEDREFVVQLRTVADISSFTFDQPSRSISFDLNDSNQFVTLAIPLELLWNPYDVYLNEKNILKHEYFKNETHVLLNVKPQNSGTVLIIGTSVVPEFPILMPLFIGLAAVILLQLKSKINLH